MHLNSRECFSSRSTSDLRFTPKCFYLTRNRVCSLRAGFRGDGREAVRLRCFFSLVRRMFRLFTSIKQWHGRPVSGVFLDKRTTKWYSFKNSSSEYEVLTSGLLTLEKLTHYRRQVIIRVVGVEGQRKLLDAKVLLVGPGGPGRLA
jgi:hypothetical protein